MFLHVHVRLYSVIPTVTYKARKPHSFGDEGVTSFKTSSKVTLHSDSVARANMNLGEVGMQDPATLS